eukprot:scaffold22240_cov20-Tisochrysis_lutea.AAC.1
MEWKKKIDTPLQAIQDIVVSGQYRCAHDWPVKYELPKGDPSGRPWMKVRTAAGMQCYWMKFMVCPSVHLISIAVLGALASIQSIPPWCTCKQNTLIFQLWIIPGIPQTAKITRVQ